MDVMQEKIHKLESYKEQINNAISTLSTKYKNKINSITQKNSENKNQLEELNNLRSKNQELLNELSKIKDTVKNLEIKNKELENKTEQQSITPNKEKDSLFDFANDSEEQNSATATNDLNLSHEKEIDELKRENQEISKELKSYKERIQKLKSKSEDFITNILGNISNIEKVVDRELNKINGAN